MITPIDFGSYSFLDLSNEAANLKVYFQSGFTGPEADALDQAIIDMSNLRLMQRIRGVQILVSATRPGLGQREVGTLVKMHSLTTFTPYSLKVPGMHTAPVYDGVGTDRLKLSAPGDTQAIALKAALDAIARHPVNGEDLIVDEIWYARGKK